VRKSPTLSVIIIWPIAHFFWGYSITLPVVLVLLWIVKRNIKVKNTKEFLKKRAVIGIVGGFWAMIPDIDYFLSNRIFSDKSISDIFFFHISLDRVLPETDLFFAAQMVLIFAVINLFAVAVTVESFKRLNEVIFGKKEDEDEDDEISKEGENGGEQKSGN
jgi:hypothetical protein